MIQCTSFLYCKWQDSNWNIFKGTQAETGRVEVTASILSVKYQAFIHVYNCEEGKLNLKKKILQFIDNN